MNVIRITNTPCKTLSAALVNVECWVNGEKIERVQGVGFCTDANSPDGLLTKLSVVTVTNPRYALGYGSAISDNPFPELQTSSYSLEDFDEYFVWLETEDKAIRVGAKRDANGKWETMVPIELHGFPTKMQKLSLDVNTKSSLCNIKARFLF